MADAFTRAKLRLLDRAMHDGRLTPGSRLVFYEITQHINRVSGHAWPSEDRIARRLDIDVKTVKRAIGPLKLYGYITVEREGRNNTYRPVLGEPPIGDNLPPVGGVPIGDNLSGDRGQIVPQIGDKNGPLSYLREPIQTKNTLSTSSSSPFKGCARETTKTSASGSQAGLPGEQDEDIRSRRDDGRVHLVLLQELGSDVLDALNVMDGGRPLQRITALRRRGPLSERDLATAKLAAIRQRAASSLTRRGAG